MFRSFNIDETKELDFEKVSEVGRTEGIQKIDVFESCCLGIRLVDLEVGIYVPRVLR